MINESRFRLKKDGTPYKDCICRTPELIENYEKAMADTTQTWYCHHRLETHNSDGERRLVDLKEEELIALGTYFDRPPEELIFLTLEEHTSLHHKGKPKSDEARKKMKGKPSNSKGKHWKLSGKTKEKMSEVRKGRNWFNNGITNVCTFECPEGFVPGMLKKKVHH